MDFYAPIGMPPRETSGYTLSPLTVAPDQTRRRPSFHLGGWHRPDSTEEQSDDSQTVWAALALAGHAGRRGAGEGADLVTAAVLLGTAGDARGDHHDRDVSADRNEAADAAAGDEPSAWPQSPAEEAPFGF